jgi:hypothetical protein
LGAVTRAIASLCFTVLAAVMPTATTPSDSSAALELRVKAAFLLKFCGYVDWPSNSFADAASPLVIGVAGSDALASELATAVEGRAVDGRPLLVRTMHSGDSLDDVHVLFIGANESESEAYLQTASHLPVLTVTEERRASEANATINFVVVDNRVRFDVELRNAQSNGVRLSSRLLSVARNVRGT